ncbi:hypothetical protein ANO11243_035200 [Dothideomycetidae sp. 11243]|nr:hypothetical protein ANO11243_035200 [fungal sp. No.11243]
MAPPIVTATLQANALAVASNITAQLLDHWRKREPLYLSAGDLLRFLLLNIIVCPPNFLWQAFLERRFPAYKKPPPAPAAPDLSGLEKGTLPEAAEEQEGDADFDWGNTAKKWFLDCITVGAVGNTLAFLVIMGVLKGKDVVQIQEAVRKIQDMLPIIFAGYKVWPVASIVSFTFIPWERRIVFLSFVGFIWGIYMSLIAARQ